MKLETGQMYERGEELIVLLDSTYRVSHATHEWRVVVLSGWYHVPLPFVTKHTEHSIQDKWKRVA